MSGLDSIYGAYPNPLIAGTDSLGMSADFMANATAQNSLAMQQALLQAYNQPQTDTFESSAKSSSGLGTGLTLGALAGVGTGAGIYYLASDPIKDGKIADGLFNASSKVYTENYKQNKFDELLSTQKTVKLSKHGLTNAQYNALEQLSKAESIDDLADAVKRELPTGIQTPEAAKAKLKPVNTDLSKINIKKLEQQAAKYAEQFDLTKATKKLKDFEAAKTQVEKLGKNATKAEVETFIKNNAQTLGISGSPEQIEQAAQRMANKYQTQPELLQRFERRITSQKTTVQNIKSAYKNAITSHWDDTAKAFKEGTPEALTKAVKNFKWGKALKFGGIAAGVGLVLGWAFGGNKA